MELLEFIDKSNKAENETELFSVFEKALSNFGYDRVLFSLLSDHTCQDLKAGHGIMQNYPDDWMTHYVEQGYETFDPVRSFVFSTSGPFLWEELPELQDLSERQRMCLFGGIESGLHSGAAVSLRGPGGEVAGVGAACSIKEATLDPNAHFILNAYSQQFYVAFCSLMEREDYNPPKIYLSDRQIEILRWWAQGKSKWEIGEILGVSHDCVDYHIRGIYKIFQTNEKLTVIVKALHRGLINL